MSGQNIKSIRQEADAQIVEVAGDITHVKSPNFREQILEQVEHANGKLIIDLTQVGYMDSSGVAILVETLKASRSNGARLILCGLNPRVYSIFEISRLTTVFAMTDDVESALKA